MIQGGGFEPGMKQKPTGATDQRTRPATALKNDKYTLAMARTSDPHSATAQFFINTTDNDFLNFKAETPQGWGYAVFGRVVDGTGRRRRDREACAPAATAATTTCRMDDVMITARRRLIARPTERDARRTAPRRAGAARRRHAASSRRPPGARSTSSRDLHLGEATPRTFEALAAHLRCTPTPMRCFILGDLFEAWIGDDARTRASSSAAPTC